MTSNENSPEIGRAGHEPGVVDLHALDGVLHHELPPDGVGRRRVGEDPEELLDLLYPALGLGRESP